MINAWVATVPFYSVTSVRKRLQGVWHRARVQLRPGVHDGGALASEAGDMCRNPCFLCRSYFVVLPQVKKSAPDGAEQAARRLEWCTSMLERLGEMNRPHLGITLARYAFLAVSATFSALSQATLQTNFTLVVQFHAFPSQFLSFRCLPVRVVGQADASCSRVAASRRRLVRRVFSPFPDGVGSP